MLRVKMIPQGDSPIKSHEFLEFLWRSDLKIKDMNFPAV